MSITTQRAFAWTEGVGLPLIVSSMEALLVTAPLAYFVLFGILKIPLFASAVWNPSISTAFTETLILAGEMLVVALSFYALASAVERWQAVARGIWLDVAVPIVYTGATIIWLALSVVFLPDQSVIWYDFAIGWLAWRIVRFVHLGRRLPSAQKEFINYTFRGGLGVLLGSAVFGVVSAAPGRVLAGLSLAIILFTLCCLCAVPFTHFVIACRTGHFPVADEARARTTWMRLVLPMMLAAGTLVAALALIGLFQWRPLPLPWPKQAHMSATKTPAAVGTPGSGNGGSGGATPGPGSGSGNGTPNSGSTTGSGNSTPGPNGSPGSGAGTPGTNGSPGPGTPGSGTPQNGGGTPGAYNGTGTPGPGVGIHGSPVPDRTGTPINNSTTPEPGTFGNGSPPPTPTRISSPSPKPSPTSRPVPSPTPSPTPTPAMLHHAMQRDQTNTILLILLILVLIVAGAALIAFLLHKRRRPTQGELILAPPEPPVREDPPFPDTVRAHYRAMLQAAVDARSNLARRTMETPAEYAQRLQAFFATPDGMKALVGIGANPAEAETIVQQLTDAYQLVRYRGDVDMPTAHGWLQTWLPTLKRLFRRPPKE
jgi:hypothetical protein